MEESLAAGKFPVFSSGLHDVYHFIIFATNPEYVKILREKSKELLKTKITRSMISRNAYTLEILSLGNPEKLSEIVKKIAIPNPTEKTTYEDFLRATQALSKEELNEKAQFWKENYKNYLISYNSAGRYPKEKISTSAYVYLDYIQYHFNNDVNLVPAPVKKPFVNQMFTEGMEYMDKVLQLLTETDPDVLKRIATEYKSSLDPENMLQIHIARMEYALWKSATTINLNQWTNDILTPTVDINSPTMKFIKDSFGKHSYIYNMFQ